MEQNPAVYEINNRNFQQSPIIAEARVHVKTICYGEFFAIGT
jgi:hypothetical protein